jgi:hypothetical protein
MPGEVEVDVQIRSEIPEVGSILRRHIGELVEGIIGDIVIVGREGTDGLALYMSIGTEPMDEYEYEV